MTGNIVEGLRTCELFSTLDDSEIGNLAQALAQSCQVESFEAGDTIFSQGEHRKKLYIIIEGQVSLQRAFYIGGREATTPVAVLGKGRAMGWTALLYGPRYVTASAICQKPTRVITIDGDDLRAILEEKPDVGFQVMARLACMLGDRLRAVYNAAECHL